MKSHPLPASGPMSSTTLAAGTMLAGRYQIEKVIGTGGMGAVYSARDRRFRAIVRRCAVKEMFDATTDAAASARARDNFEREANLLASLNHHAIPKVFDYFTEGERHYLVYEYIEGQDLARVLHQRARPMPPDRVTDWAIQLTRVLEALHSSDPPIIFRDLKPSNVMLRADGQIVLVDFGIAKHFQPVQKGTMIGTEGYAPPEQYEGVANARVDLYALGATLHQLLTNTDPQEFRPFSYNQRPIRQHNPVVSPELDTIVMRALAYNADERWEDARALRVALEGLQAGATSATNGHAPTAATAAPTALRPAPPSTSGSGLFARRLRERGAATQPVASEPAPADSSTRQIPGAGAETRPVADPAMRRAPAAIPESTQPLPADSDAAIVPLWTFATEDEVRSTPEIADGALFIGSYDTNLYCLDLATGDFRWKYATNGGVPGTPTVWGELVIVGSEDFGVYALDRRTGRLAWSAQTQARVRSSPRVGLDHVIVGSDDGHVYGLSALRGHLMWKTNLGAPVRSSAAIGEKLLFIGAEDGTIAGLDLLSGEAAWRVRTGGPVISSPTLAAERVIVGSMDRQLYGIDPRSGWVIWRTRLSDRVYSSPVVAEERAFVCAVDGSLYCLDAEWGKEIWKLSLGTQVTSSPVVDERGRLFIGSVSGTLLCVDTRKGKVLWRFSTGGPLPGSPRVRGGALFFGSMDHRVYAIPTDPRLG